VQRPSLRGKKEETMQVVYPCCCRLDVLKKSITACLLLRCRSASVAAGRFLAYRQFKKHLSEYNDAVTTPTVSLQYTRRKGLQFSDYG
jgi:hypothetical protein